MSYLKCKYEIQHIKYCISKSKDTYTYYLDESTWNILKGQLCVCGTDTGSGIQQYGFKSQFPFLGDPNKGICPPLGLSDITYKTELGKNTFIFTGSNE